MSAALPLDDLAAAIRVERDPERLRVLLEVLRAEQRRPRTPADFAQVASRGRWVLTSHLAILNRMIADVAASAQSRFVIVSMPPRHGKSELISRYATAWYLGSYPDRRLIFTSYESDFAARWGRYARDLLSEHGPSLFGVSVAEASSAANRWDIAQREGGMVAVGMGGALTGRGGHLIVIDDPVKGWLEAQSAAYREHQWEWYLGTLRHRLEPGGSIILVMTRWHPDDLAGRLLAASAADPDADRWEEIRLPAIAEPDDASAVDLAAWRDLIGRQVGEALWPDRFPADVLAQLRRSLGPMVFDGLYQQRPSVKEGAMFRIDRWEYADAAPAGLQWIRRWDLAATRKERGNDPDWTAGVLMARDAEGFTYVTDAVRFREDDAEVRRRIRAQAELDCDRWGTRAVRLSQDPGQAGKAQAAEYRRDVLAGFDVRTSRETGDKVQRASPFAAQQNAGNVRLIRGDWPMSDYIEEFRLFPNGSHDDWVDASANAYLELAQLSGRRSARVIV